MNLLANIYQLKQAYLTLKEKPGFVFSVVITMGITLGALLCVLTLAYVMLFKPLPYTDSEQLFKVDHVLTKVGENWSDANFSYPSLINLYKNQQIFSDTAMIFYGERILTSHQAQLKMNTTYVTPEWFSLFNMPLTLGRVFTLAEGMDSNIPLAVLSYDTWRNVFNSDEDILGEKIRFRDISFTVIGVAGKHFIEPELMPSNLRNNGHKSQVWLSWDFNNLSSRGRRAWGGVDESMVFVGKLAAEFSPESAEQLITPLINDKWQAGVAKQSFFNDWQVTMRLRPMKLAILGDHQQSVFMLLAGVFGLVLIACSNIANLFIARMAQLQQVLAISAAVGAKKSQLFKLLLAESALLMCSALLLALIIASVGFAVLQQNLAQVFPRIDEVSLNYFTLMSALLFAFLFSLFFALLGSKMVNYQAISHHLHSGSKGISVQVSSKIRQLLIISQVAIASVLVFGNISLFTAALKTINEPLGVNTANFVDVDFSTARNPTQEERDGPVLGTAIKNSLLALPQVEAVSNSPSPLSGFNEWTLTNVETDEHIIPQVKYVDEQYFQLLGQPLLAGDYFTLADIREGFTAPEGKVDNMVIIVNDVLAKRLIPEGDDIDNVLGKKILMGFDELFTVIGIVKGMKMPGAKRIPERVYVPSSVHSISMIVKLKPNQTLTREQVVTAVNKVTSLFALFSMKDVAAIHQQLLFSERATAFTTGTLALLTIFLAALGLFGILSYSTQMRRYEIGTRLALGAKRSDIIRLVVRDNAKALVLGIIIAVFVLVGLVIAFSSQLQGTINLNFLPLFLVTLLVIATVAFNACYLPLRQYINKPALYSLRGSD